MKQREIVRKIIFLVVIMYIFLVGIKLMGGSFKLFGQGFAESLFDLAAIPFVALFVGILATALVQSSSVTTSIIVGLVGGGVLPIAGAIPMVMGANIGTSVTNTIVSLGLVSNRDEFRKAFEVATVHDFFNLIVVLILFPLELYLHLLERSATWIGEFFLGGNLGMEFSSPLDYVVKPMAAGIMDILNDGAVIILALSMAMIFFSLRYFVKIMKPLAQTEFKDKLNEHVFSSPGRSFAFGVMLTILVQSSSVSTSLVVPLAGVGIVTLGRLFPYIIGANIGTTVTAMLASLVTGSPAAVIVGLTHLLFNVFGAIFVYPFRSIPIGWSRKLAVVAMKRRWMSVAYIACTFYALPLAVILYFA
jgi:solute carrier family 34 (sodium-dependent phosphate cotransporter)